jgi:ubiquinone/menaquinone biosynthesis C-methylase UbiE
MKTNFSLYRLLKLNVNELARNQWLEKILLNLDKGKKILDAGAGERKYAPFCAHLKYVSQDFCQYDGQGADGLHPGSWNTSKIDIVSDIISIPVEDDSFDYVLCTEVLEHIPDPGRAIQELARVLSPGGQLILTAPFASMTHFSPYFFSTGFSRFWYEQQARINCLEITELTANGSWFDVLYTQLMIAPGMAEKLSKERNFYKRLFRILLTIALIPPLLLLRLASPSGGSEISTFGYFVIMKKRLIP